MVEYIEREAMLDNLREEYHALIEKSKELEFVQDRHFCNAQIRTLVECIGRVKEQPTVDVVPVIRCKDCDFFNNYNPDRTYCEEHSDGWGDSIVYVDEDDYCSFGIRKR